MSGLHVPARDIPVPTSIGPEAQAVLGGASIAPVAEYPPLDDTDAWRAMIAAQTEMVVGFLTAQAKAVDASYEWRDIDAARFCVVTPNGCEDDRIVLELHGGALILMAGEACAAMAVFAAARSRKVTWGVDYRMPPDHPYPAALDDCVRVYRALLEETTPDRIVVSGGSAGGNLAAALMLRARDEGLPMPAVLHLATPEIDLTESGDTFQTNLGVDTVLGLLRPVNELYAAGHDLSHPYLSPLFGDVSGFPPTVLTSGTRDLFLSNTVRMHRSLRRAGVEAELHVMEAAPHGGFMGMTPEDAEVAADVRRFIDRYCPPR